MKNESVAEMLRSGEIQMTDDVLFMVNLVLSMFQRGIEYQTGAQFITTGMQLLTLWRDELDNCSQDTALADEALANIVAGPAK